MGPDPREQFPECERLGQVVAGAQVEAGDHVIRLGQGREHDHRQRLVALADRLEHLQPTELGEEDVEQDQREVLRACQRQTLIAVVRAGDRVAVGLEPALHELGDRALVFDHQDAHRGNARWEPQGSRDLLRELSSGPYGRFMASTEHPHRDLDARANPTYESDRRFKLFGSHVRVLIGAPVRARPSLSGGYGNPDRVLPAAPASQADPLRRAQRPLCSESGSGEPACPGRSDPAAAVDAALWAARRSDGLVDPTLVSELEARATRARAPTSAGSIRDALAVAPDRKAARPRADSRWREIAVDPGRRWSRDPAGFASTPAAPARAWPPTSPPSGSAATRPSSSMPVAISVSAESARGAPGSHRPSAR